MYTSDISVSLYHKGKVLCWLDISQVEEYDGRISLIWFSSKCYKQYFRKGKETSKDYLQRFGRSPSIRDNSYICNCQHHTLPAFLAFLQSTKFTNSEDFMHADISGLHSGTFKPGTYWKYILWWSQVSYLASTHIKFEQRIQVRLIDEDGNIMVYSHPMVQNKFTYSKKEWIESCTVVYWIKTALNKSRI